MAKISVIIPVYNAAAFLIKAVNSCLNQPEVGEVIIIEDNSPDNALEIANNLASKHSKIKVYQHPDKKNHGAGASRNLGIEKAQYDYIAFLDADDYYLPNRFKKTIQAFKAYPNALGIHEAVIQKIESNFIMRDYQKKIKPDYLIRFKSNVSTEEIFETYLTKSKKYGWTHLNGFTIKRDLVKIIGYFDSSLLQAEDTDYILQAFLTGRIYPGELSVPIAIRRVHNQNSVLDRKKAMFYTHKLYFKWFQRMFSEKWSKRVNYFIFRNLISHYNFWATYNKSIIVKYTIKSIYALFLIIRYPKALIKIIKK